MPGMASRNCPDRKRGASIALAISERGPRDYYARADGLAKGPLCPKEIPK
jgi:hypothetical protein